MLGIAYSRISSTAQEGGLGLERQQADPSGYCAARGWTLWDGPSYSDSGISAFGGKNISDGDLGRFLRDVNAGVFGAEPLALLIEDIDRVSRTHPLSILPVLIDEVLNAGITIAVMGKGRDISRKSVQQNSMELHELLFWLGSSHDFSDKLSRRISHVQKARREKVRAGEAVAAGLAPSWLELDAQGLWVFNDYAQVIRRVLKMAEEMGCTHIAQELNQEGVPCPGEIMRQRQKPSRSGKPRRPLSWNAPSVRQLIVHPAVIGARSIVTPGHKALERDWREECARLLRQGVKTDDLPKHPPRTYEAPQRNYYPALLSEAEQLGLIASMERRRTSTVARVHQVKWIAAGLTTCGVCGSRMGAIGGTQATGRKRVYLRCKGVAKRLGCTAGMVPLLAAQATLLTRLCADNFLAMLEEQSGGAKIGKLAAAMAQQAKAQAAVDHQEAALRAGAGALEDETDSGVVRVLAKRQQAVEVALETAQRELRVAQAAVQQLQGHPGERVIATAMQVEVRALLQKFARQEDTVDDRRGVHHHLERLGLRVVLDGNDQRLGLAVGGAAPQWQPIIPTLAADQLEAGRAGVQYASLFVSKADIIEAARKAKESGTDEVELPFSITDGDLTIPGQIVGE